MIGNVRRIAKKVRALTVAHKKKTQIRRENQSCALQYRSEGGNDDDDGGGSIGDSSDDGDGTNRQ